ncbi:pirin [Pseudoflavitalea sp. X16]|uniref:pirin family protein n=1 Tax=Paraflavitalea devenefica TaxID=2716334 RepID=UPI0014218C0A|nr:pirin [Paraflavitalea devenefica]NII28495.1 pirin [Paraflavitalea devenefica]
MIPQSKGKIFLSDERGHHELDWFRSYHTFNFGQYQHEHKGAMGPLYVLNDETLAGGKSVTLMAEEDSDILLVPVVGALSVKDGIGNSCLVDAGQCYLATAPAGTAIELSNPYEEELINFLQVWFKRGEANVPSCKPAAQLCSFDLYANKDKLVELFPRTGSWGHEPITSNKPYGRQFIGKFTGRAEITHTITSPYNGLFVFVIEGAFEVQYRMLHAGDGLALWDLQEVEFEALSNDAIILVVEMMV